MLIAFMGDTFERVQEVKEQAEFKEYLSMIIENWFLLDDRMFKHARYLQLFEVEKMEGVEECAWEGKIKALKRNMTRQGQEIKGDIGDVKKQIDKMREEIREENNKKFEEVMNAIKEIKKD